MDPKEEKKDESPKDKEVKKNTKEEKKKNEKLPAQSEAMTSNQAVGKVSNENHQHNKMTKSIQESATISIEHW